jgi:glycosyltransferase involved in cell wall biosynthesis
MLRWTRELRRLAVNFISLATNQGMTAALLRLRNWTDLRLRTHGAATPYAVPAGSGRSPSSSAPSIAVIVPVFNTPPRFLEACIESVRAQSHPRWELCLCDDASSSPATLAVLDRYQGSDPRIRILRSPVNLHIAAASNLAAEQASAEFIAFLDHDDCLHPDALAELALAAEGHPDVDLIYTDEDKIEADGAHSEPYCKPDWSPEHLRSVMYVLHCLCIRKQVVWSLGGPSRGL